MSISREELNVTMKGRLAEKIPEERGPVDRTEGQSYGEELTVFCLIIKGQKAAVTRQSYPEEGFCRI